MNDQKDECPDDATDRAPLSKHTDREILPDNNVGINESDALQKAEATVIARLAIAGHSAHKCDTGYLVSRWNYAIHKPDLDSLIEFADKVCGSRP